MMDSASISLNDDQNQALSNFKLFLADSTEREMILSGSAGTGKSFMTKVLINEIRKTSFKLIVTAPTHKACKVLREFNDDSVTVQTIHRATKTKMVTDIKTGLLVPFKMGTLDSDNKDDMHIIIIDECSMVNNDMLAIIREEAFFDKILYVGDGYQIPPVRYVHAPVFKTVITPYNTELKQVVRQAEDNPILKLALRFRKAQDGECDTPVLRGTDDIEEFLAKFNPDTDLIIAGSNDKVKLFNAIIRKRLGRSDRYEIGETLVANEAITFNGELVIENNTEMVVTANTDGESHGIRGQVITVESSEDVNRECVLRYEAMKLTKRKRSLEAQGKPIELIELERKQAWGKFYRYCEKHDIDPDTVESATDIFTFTVPNDPLEFDRLLSEYHNKALAVRETCDAVTAASKQELPLLLVQQLKDAWNERNNIMAVFADFRPPYACTVHKSQGTTVKNAFIDLNTISGRNINKLMYTALTRATDHNYMYGVLR